MLAYRPSNSPMISWVVPSQSTYDACWTRTGQVEGFTSRSRHCLGGFRPTLRGSQVATLPWVPRPACAFGAGSPKGDYRLGSVAKSR